MRPAVLLATLLTLPGLAATAPALPGADAVWHTWWSLWPTACGTAPAAKLAANVGFDCGSADVGLAFACEEDGAGGATCDVRLLATGYASYWANAGALEVSVEGTCAAAEAMAWAGQEGAAPASLDVACGPVAFAIPDGTCATFDGWYNLTWRGAHPPPPVGKHLWLDYCF